MNCPECTKKGIVTRLITIDSRASGIGLRRRKRCKTCEYRFTTYELPIDSLNALVASGGVMDLVPVQNALLEAFSALERASQVNIFPDSQLIRDRHKTVRQIINGSIGAPVPPEQLALVNPSQDASDSRPPDAESQDSPGASLPIFP